MTGSGFPSGQTGIEVGLISTSTVVTSSTVLSNDLCLTDLSLVTTTTSGQAACYTTDSLPGSLVNNDNTYGIGTGDKGYAQVTADANGAFTVVFQVPFVTGAPDKSYNVAATYSTSSGYVLSNSVPFTVTPVAAVVGDYSGASSGTYNTRVDLLAAGFAASETIQILPSSGFLTTQPWGATAISTFVMGSDGSTALEGLVTSGGTAYESGYAPCGSVTTFAPTPLPSIATPSTCDMGFISDHKQTTSTVQFIGLSSGNTASTTFSFFPSIEFQTTGVGTTFVLPASAGTGAFFGHSFASAETISANSLTIGGVTTIQSSITASSTGAFGPISFTYTSSLPAGVLSATFDGMTFNWANGNIVAPPILQEFEDVAPLNPAGLIFAATNTIAFNQLDAGNHKVGQISLQFGSCFGTAQAWCGGGAITVFTGSVGTYSTALGGFTTTSYPFSASTTVANFGSKSVSTIGSSAGNAYPVALDSGMYGYWDAFQVPASYGGSSTGTIQVAAPLGTPPSTSLTINMGNDLFYKPTSGAGYEDPYPANVADNTGTSFTSHVTGWNETDTSANVYLGSTFWGNCALSTSSNSSQFASPGTATCDLNTVSTLIPDIASGFYTVWVNGTASTNYGTEHLEIVPVAGSTSLSATSVSPGTIVGLLTASGAGIHGLAASTKYTVEFSGQNMTTFTSTATGQVPPGVQFAAPSGTSGQHIVDIIGPSGSSALYQHEISSTTNPYGNMIVTISNTLTSTPSSGPTGSTVAITGGGLASNQLYYVWIPLTLGGTTYASYTSFTTTATGTIPAGVSVTFPNLPTSTSTCSGTSAPEQGTTQSIYVAAQSSDIGSSSPSKPTGTASFFLEGSLVLANASLPAGSLENISVAGLCASTNYQIVFNYQLASTGTAYIGTTVGSVSANTNGQGSGTFTVPASVSAGSYTIQLVRSGYTLGVLSVAPTLTVGAPSTSGLSTNTFAATSSATEASVNGQATISQTFTNSYTSALSVYMWVSVQNSAGQTVGVFLGSASVAAGGSSPIGAALFNLPSGTYSATVFVTTTSGIVISKTSTATFTV